MRRRDLLGVVGAAVAWPLAARAQQPAMPLVGVLSSGSPGPFAPAIAAFRAGLKEAGYTEGQNFAIEYRWAEDRYDRLPALAAELIRQQVAVIVASGGPAPALAAKAATTTVPVVFTAVSDPVKSGLVASMNRPGSNVTGFAALTIELDAKRLELLRELAPSARDLAAIVNPNRPDVDAQVNGMMAAAQSVGWRLCNFKGRHRAPDRRCIRATGRAEIRRTARGSGTFFPESACAIAGAASAPCQASDFRAA